jgi:acyl carrier protein
MNTRQRVRQFIIENFYVSDPSEIADDTLLVTTGVVDSTGMLEVIGFLEAEFGIHIEDREMTPENLESVERMAAFVERKSQANAG